MKRRFIISGKLSPARNMAIDEAVFVGVSEGRSFPTIRFYDWEPPTVSCGYNQEIAKEIDFNALEKFGFGFIRRPTGGRIVLHNQEVTYSVISPISERLSGNVSESYSEISKALAEGLRMLGVNVEFEKGSLSSFHQRQTANPCFTSSSRFELNYQNKKIVGSAQVRKDNFLLQHGSILLNYNQSKMAYILPKFDDKQKEYLAEYLTRKTISINEILEAPVSFNEAVKAFISGFQKSWNDDEFYICEDIEFFEKGLTENLMTTKYLTDEWNKRK